MAWNQNTHFMFSNFYFESHADYEAVWKNIVESNRPQMIIWRMRVACWITKTIDTRNIEYLLLFHDKSGCTNAPQCYLIRKLPVLFQRGFTRRCRFTYLTHFVRRNGGLLFYCCRECAWRIVDVPYRGCQRCSYCNGWLNSLSQTSLFWHFIGTIRILAAIILRFRLRQFNVCSGYYAL